MTMGNVVDKHQKRIAKSTLKMSDVGARIMGGMTKEEARRILSRLGLSQTAIDTIERS